MTAQGCASLVRGCRELVDISLAEMRIGDDTVFEIASSCGHSLTHLDLPACPITDAAIAALAGPTPPLPAEHGSAPALGISGVCVRGASCPCLRRLRLLACPHLTDAAVHAAVCGLPDLEELNLQGCDGITAAAVEAARRARPLLCVEAGPALNRGEEAEMG